MRALFLLMLRSAPQERVSKHEAKNSSFETTASRSPQDEGPDMWRRAAEKSLSLRRHDPDQVQRVFLSPERAPLGTGLM